MNMLAVDIGGSHASCAVVSGQKILACRRIDLKGSGNLCDALPTIANVLQDIMASVDIPTENCAGIAFSFCGLVDSVRCCVMSTHKYSDAPSIDLQAWAEKQFGLPLCIENDARMALLGERHAGAAVGYDNIAMLTFGTGIGGAAMIEGRLLRGKHYQAGCLGGHMLVRFGGLKCVCGASGCMEAEASSWALLGLCQKHPAFSASPLKAMSHFGFAELIQWANAGDTCAHEVFVHCINVWSAGIVSLIHAYDPEVVVIGGGVMNAADQILPIISDYVHQRAWTPWGEVQVRRAILGDGAALLGAEPFFEALKIGKAGQ